MVLLVRHGRTPTTGQVLPGRAAGLHLSDEGTAQAEAVAERIGALADAPASRPGPRSPSTRHPSSGRPRRHGPSPGAWDCGSGPTAASSSATSASGPVASSPTWPRSRSGRRCSATRAAFRFPGGESFLEMQTRMSSALARLVERHRGETIVAVSHADPIKAVVAQAAGTPLDLFQRLTVAPCSVSALAYTRRRPVRAHRQLDRVAHRAGHRMSGARSSTTTTGWPPPPPRGGTTRERGLRPVGRPAVRRARWGPWGAACS